MEPAGTVNLINAPAFMFRALAFWFQATLPFSALIKRPSHSKVLPLAMTVVVSNVWDVPVVLDAPVK